jgi:hypothetical protein
MAKDRLPQFPTIRITTASRALAMLRSRQAVKREHRSKASSPRTTAPGRSQAGPCCISKTTQLS